MIDSTTVVMGPGGVGKGPLDALFKADVRRLDPYRLRRKGPKQDREDPFYAHPQLRDQLQLVFSVNGDQNRRVGPGVEWFPKSGALFFKVRVEWQLLMLLPLRLLDGLAKLEIFAPVLPTLLSDAEIAGLFGDIEVLLLNPASTSVGESDDSKELQDRTRENCRKRKDSENDVETRVRSIADEAPAWKVLISKWREQVTEMTDWAFPECDFKNAGSLEKQKCMLREARDRIVQKNSRFAVFLKTDEEIDSISEPIVKLA